MSAALLMRAPAPTRIVVQGLTDEELAETLPRVQAGIRFLEDRGIDWRKIALHPGLDMTSAQHCMLARALQTNYTEYLINEGLSMGWAVRHGFTTTEKSVSHTHLRMVWQKLASLPPPETFRHGFL